MRAFRHVSLSLLAVIASVSYGSRSSAQSRTAATCEDLLKGATKDSVVLLVEASVRAFDRSRDLSAAQQRDFVQALRGSLVLPAPLAIDTYEMSGRETALGNTTAHLSLYASYRATITRDGHLTEISVAGGVRNAGFDRAMIAALAAMDSGGLVAGLTKDGLPAEGVPISIAVTTRSPRGDETRVLPDSEMPVPLFRFRAPLRRVTQRGMPIAQTAFIRYPAALSNEGAPGEVVLRYVVTSEGLVDVPSHQFLRATRREFAEAVFVALPAMRFHPLRLEGCAVPFIAQLPVEFSAQ